MLRLEGEANPFAEMVSCTGCGREYTLTAGCFSEAVSGERDLLAC